MILQVVHARWEFNFILDFSLLFVVVVCDCVPFVFVGNFSSSVQQPLFSRLCSLFHLVSSSSISPHSSGFSMAGIHPLLRLWSNRCQRFGRFFQRRKNIGWGQKSSKNKSFFLLLLFVLLPIYGLMRSKRQYARTRCTRVSRALPKMVLLSPLLSRSKFTVDKKDRWVYQYWKRSTRQWCTWLRRDGKIGDLSDMYSTLYDTCRKESLLS